LGAKSHLRSDAALWIALVVPPLAWGADLTISYAFVKWSCGHQNAALLRGIPLATLLVIAAAGAIGWSADRENERADKMAMMGSLMTGLFVVLTIAMGIPRWVFDVCQ
jgi:hypothetical protein